MSLIKRLIDYFYARRKPIEFARRIGVFVVHSCRLISVSRSTFGSEPFLITLGDHVTVTSGVRFVTHDGGVWVFRDEYPNIEVFGGIQIGNNVFIGINSVLMLGTKVGDNVVIGAGSVVRGVQPGNLVYAGVPVRPIMTIEEYREKSINRAIYTRGLSGEEKVAAIKASIAHE